MAVAVYFDSLSDPNTLDLFDSRGVVFHGVAAHSWMLRRSLSKGRKLTEHKDGLRDGSSLIMVGVRSGIVYAGDLYR